MALERLFGPILDIARSIVGGETETRRSSPPPAYEPLRSSPPPAPVEAAPAPALIASIEAAPAPVEAMPTDADDAEEEPYDGPSEPIVSLPMARLLASQGHHHRALAVYDALLRRDPASPALRAEADALRSQAAGPDRPSDEGEESLAGENEIVAVRASDRDVLLSWQVGGERIARGRKLLPQASEMAVRLVLFHRGEGREIRKEERERVVERAGEWLVADVPRDSWMTASIGLRHEGRFVSLTHSSASRTP